LIGSVAAAEELAACPRNINAACRIARRYSRTWPKLADEFESECYVALVEASRSFDPERGVKFCSHMSNRVHGAMLDIVRNWIPKGYRRNFDASPRVMTIEGLTKDDLISDDGPVGWEMEYQDDLHHITRGLSTSERAVIHALYGHAERITMSKAGRAIGVCESRASQLHASAIEEMKHYLQETPHVSCDECDEYDPSGSG